MHANIRKNVLDKWYLSYTLQLLHIYVLNWIYGIPPKPSYRPDYLPGVGGVEVHRVEEQHQLGHHQQDALIVDSDQGIIFTGYAGYGERKQDLKLQIKEQRKS